MRETGSTLLALEVNIKRKKKKEKKTTVISLKYCTAHILGSQCGFLAEGCIAIIMQY